MKWKNVVQALQAACLLFVVFGVAACGAGLVLIALDNSVNQMSFIRLALGTLGSSLIGAVVGAFLYVQEKDKQKKSEAGSLAEEDVSVCDCTPRVE